MRLERRLAWRPGLEASATSKHYCDKDRDQRARTELADKHWNGQIELFLNRQRSCSCHCTRAKPSQRNHPKVLGQSDIGKPWNRKRRCVPEHGLDKVKWKMAKGNTAVMIT